MRAITSPKEILALTSKFKKNDQTVGLVPTMGALHDGHLSLIDRSISENDITVVSIFINSHQFNRKEDFDNYPRSILEDKKMLESNGVDFLFEPSDKELYAQTPNTSITFGGLELVLEGKFRPGHFGGVGLIVSKLLNLINPARAYFGLKDLQQYILIKKMVEDLNFPVDIVGVDTVREESGLAMSSRNRRLSKSGLEIASNLFTGLSIAGNSIHQKRNLKEVKKDLKSFYESVAGLDMEYMEFVSAPGLKSADNYDELDALAICVAGHVEGVRLIDNLYLQLQ